MGMIDGGLSLDRVWIDEILMDGEADEINSMNEGMPLEPTQIGTVRTVLPESPSASQLWAPVMSRTIVVEPAELSWLRIVGVM